MTRCTETRESLVAYLDGELEAGRSRGVRVHLEACSECAAAATRQRQVWELLGDDARPEASDGFAERVVRAARSGPGAATAMPRDPEGVPAATSGTRSMRSAWRWGVFAIAASALVAIWALRPVDGGSPRMDPGVEHGTIIARLPSEAVGDPHVIEGSPAETSTEPAAGEDLASELTEDDWVWIEENWESLVFLEEVELDALLDETAF